MTSIEKDLKSLNDLLAARASEQPEDLAYRFLENGEGEGSTLTYGELEARVRTLAAALQEAGATGGRALILCPPGLEFIMAFLGCLYAGVVAVPTYPPRSPKSLPRVRVVARDARAEVALTDAASREKLVALASRDPGLAELTWLTTDEVSPDLAARWRDPGADRETVAFLQYTSGSTAAPKGVMVSHGNLLHNEELIRRAFGQSKESVVVGWLPLYHDMGLIGNVLQPLYVGARCILMSPLDFLRRPRRWLEAISHYRGTTSGGPNFAYDLCVRKIPPEEREGLDLSSWHVAFNGAEPVRAETLDRFAEAFAPQGFERRAFLPCYGLAEGTLLVTAGRDPDKPRAVPFDPSSLEKDRVEPVGGDSEGRRLVSCGLLPEESGQSLTIADPETGKPCSPDRVGEIWVGGPSVAGGYWQRPEVTRETFEARLASGEGPFLRTGDLGFLHDGELYVTGRLKDLIIIRGRNHYPQDVERTVETSHPAMRGGGSAAFSVDVEGEERLVVVQEIRRTALRDLDAEAVVEAVRLQVAEVHDLTVHAVVLVKPGGVLKTTSGKVRRQACRQAWLDGELPVVHDDRRMPEPGEDAPPTAASDTSDGLEPLLRRLVRDVADGQDLVPGRPLILDSLQALELAGRLERELEVEAPVDLLLEHPTPEELVRQLEKARGTQRSGRMEIPTAVRTRPSHGQRALWWIARLAPESSAEHVAVAARCVEPLGANRLERALEDLMARHPSLRTSFPEEAAGPIRRVRPHVEVPFARRKIPGSMPQALAREAEESFDLAAGPLFRVRLLEAPNRDPVLLLVFHHLIVDLESLVILARELGALLSGIPVDELPAAASYDVFVATEAERLAGARGEELLEWWTQRLADGAPVLELPTDRPRPPLQSFRGGSVRFELEAETSDRIHRLAEGAEVTPFAVLLAAYQVFLARESGQRRFQVGTPVTLRRPGLERTVGYLVDPVVLRSDVAEGSSFLDLVHRAQQEVRSSLAHRDLPFSHLVEALRPDRDPSRSPLFQAMLTWQQAPRNEALTAFALGEPGIRVDLDGLALESVEVPHRSAQFDLSLVLAQKTETLGGTLEYASDLFDATTASRFARRFAHLVAALTEEPERPVLEAPSLTAPERHHVLREWNDTAAPWPDDVSVDELWSRRARRSPRAVAVRGSDGETLTYEELEHAAERLARALKRRGIGPGSRVGLALDRTPRLLAAVWAVWRLGAAYVPLDPSYPRERLDYMAEDAGLALRVTEPVLAELEAEAVADDASEPFAPVCFGGEQVAYVIYTSGSTGRPKGVVIPHRALLNFLYAMARRPGLTSEDAVLAVTSLSFDISTLELYLPLLFGARVELADREEAGDGSRLLRRLESCGATMMQATPATWRLLLAAGWEGTPELQALCGGEALPADLAAEIRSRSAALWNMYGPTETTVWSAVHRVRRDESPVLLGHPIANTSLVVTEARGSPVPAGVAGELRIGGAGLARGYLGRPGQTAARFVPDSVSGVPGARLYRTGDRVRLRPGGELEFQGRFDHQVKVRGFRIEPGEVEAALAAIPGVAEAVVTAPMGDDGTRRLAAYVVPAEEGGESASPEPAALRKRLAAVLPAHEIPSLFVVLDELPLTPNGKVDRKALPEPSPDASGESRGFAAPQDRLERRVADAWAEALGMERVGRRDHFFDLGGHSLLLAQVQAKLERELERSISLVDLFRHPTVAAQAEFLRSGHEEPPAARGRGPRRRADASRDASIAIVGLAGRFPGAADANALWDNLRRGVESIRRLSDEEVAAAGVAPEIAADPAYVPAAGVLDGVDRFDAEYFDVAAREAEVLDPQHRLMLEVAVEALEDAGLDPDRPPGDVGIFCGVGLPAYLLHQIGPAENLDPAAGYELMLGNDKDFVATRIAYKLGLTGPGMVVQTACSSSLVAVHLACRSLLDDECDAVLAGGVSIGVPQNAGYLWQQGMILSPDGHCRAFDEKAQGTVRGHGLGLVVLKRLDDALADGDRIRAVIRGSAINNDGGHKVGYTAPSVERQAAVIRDALATARVDPATVSYVEAHGTGTEMGDPIEVSALKLAFGESPPTSCGLGSVKTNVGHLDAAAGVTGLIKTVLALEREEIPPTLHFEKANPRLELGDGPFHVVDSLQPWPRNDRPRRAGVSSFGIGGTNAHVIVEEAPRRDVPQDASDAAPPWHLLGISARSADAADAAGERLGRHLETRPDLGLGDVAYTLATGRRELEHRRFVVARTREDAVDAWTSRDAGRVLGARRWSEKASVAFLFPGQGAQHPGMGRELYEHLDVFRRGIDQAAETLEPHLSLDLRQVLYPEPDDASAIERAAERLRHTRFTQPALFAVEHALAETWASWGVEPAAMLGHSVGEYVAACRAGVFSFEDGLRLMAERGRLLDELPGGSMLSVARAPEEIEPLLGDTLSVAVVNAPGACVVSGASEVVAELEERLVEQDIETRPLHTSHAFHSPMMDPALDAFRRIVETVPLSPPTRPLLSNVTGTWMTAEEATDPAYWVRHLRSTVRFADGVARLLEAPDQVLLEVGPGQGLGSLARRHPAYEAGRPVIHCLAHPKSPEPAGDTAATALGRLWLAGVPVAWDRVFAGRARRKVELPTYPFEGRRYWIEAGSETPRDTEAPDAGPGRRPPAEWVYLPSRKRSLPPTMAKPVDPEEGPETWWIVGDGRGLARTLEETLAAAGRRVVRIAETARREDFLRQAEDAGTPRGVIHLRGLDLGNGDEGHDAVDLAGFRALVDLNRVLASAAETQPVTVCLAGPETDPRTAAMQGLLRVAAQENPGLDVRLVELDAAPKQARRLAAEALAELSGGGEVVIWRGEERWTESYEPVALSAPGDDRDPPWRDDTTHVILGGFGGIGRALARRMAERARVRLVLVGRSELPPRDLWDGLDEKHPAASKRVFVRELEDLGAHVLPVSADMTEAREMRQVLHRAEERFGSVESLFHAAGVTGLDAARPLGEMDDEALETQLRAKVRSIEHLIELSRERPTLRAVVFSSLSSVLGGLGYGAYAAAHRAVDVLVENHVRETGAPWLTVDWDGWRLGDEAPTHAQGEMRDLAMAPKEGLDLLERLLDRGLVGRIVVSTGHLDTRFDRWVRRSPGEAAASRDGSSAAERSGDVHPRPELQTRYVAPGTPEEKALAELWGNLLGLERVGIHDNFFELGGTSLVGVRMVAEIRRRFEVDVPTVSLYESPTVQALAERVSGSGNGAGSTAPQRRRKSRDRGRRRRERLRRRRRSTETGDDA